MTKDEQPQDENQSSLEDYFTQSDIPSDDSLIDDPQSNPEVSSRNNPISISTNDNEPSEDATTEEEEDSGVEVSVGESDTPSNLPPSFLLSVDYSGAHNKAIARLYHPETKRVFFWFDNTGHKPYCYTDWPPQAVEAAARKSSGFLKAEIVELHDLLKDEPVKMTKVVGDNPLAIGGSATSVRNVLVDNNNVSHAWEAAIRYQLCYTYDSKLVPGLMYKIENSKLVSCPPKVDAKTLEEFKKSVLDEEGLESIIKEYSPMFFTEVPTIRRLAIDIEVYTPVVNRIPDTRTAEYQVTAIGFSDSEGYDKCFVLRREGHLEGKKGTNFPKELEIVYFEDEAEMLVEAFGV
ncbi:MAG: 3'-5' exonuclease, partial [Candidatus Thorarchaeota archaeon]